MNKAVLNCAGTSRTTSNRLMELFSVINRMDSEKDALERIIYRPMPQCAEIGTPANKPETIDENLDAMTRYVADIADRLHVINSELSERLGEAKII
jgi:hypothetical protein